MAAVITDKLPKYENRNIVPLANCTRVVYMIRETVYKSRFICKNDDKKNRMSTLSITRMSEKINV